MNNDCRSKFAVMNKQRVDRGDSAVAEMNVSSHIVKNIAL